MAKPAHGCAPSDVASDIDGDAGHSSGLVSGFANMLDNLRINITLLSTRFRRQPNSRLLNDEQMLRLMRRKKKSFESASERLGQQISLNDLLVKK